MESSENAVNTIRSIITRGNGQILLERGVLPGCEGGDFIAASKTLSEILGAEIAPLHQDSRYVHPDDPAQQTWVFEHLEPPRLPTAWHWIGPEILERPLNPSERAALKTHFAELNVLPAHRQAWQRPGWLEMARAWLREQLPGSTPLQVTQSWHGGWCGSSSLDGRRLFFKALPAVLQREVKLVPLLRDFSNAIPETAALDKAQNWLVTWGAGERALIRDDDPEHWQQALRNLALLQRRTLAHRAALEQAGCVALTPEQALDETRSFLESSSLEHVPAALKQLTAMDEKLELLRTLGLPLALTHGDFHPMNVIAPASIIDWSDAMIAHPFTDLERFLRWIMGGRQPHPWSPFADTRALESRFVDAYLEPWSDLVPLERLRGVFHATRPFGFLSLIAGQVRMQREQKVVDLRLQRSLNPQYVRQLASFNT